MVQGEQSEHLYLYIHVPSAVHLLLYIIKRTLCNIVGTLLMLHGHYHITHTIHTYHTVQERVRINVLPYSYTVKDRDKRVKLGTELEKQDY